MRIDIRTAGLPSQAEPRARLAAQLIAAFGYEARVSSWDGTRCHVLIADADDAYGARCLEQAVRRGISVLALSQEGKKGPGHAQKLPAQSPAAAIAKQLASMLEEKKAQSKTSNTEGNGLVMLALVPSLATGLFKAQRQQHSILINRHTGRVYARSESELLAAQAELHHPDWDFSAIMPSTDISDLCRYSMALDAFCVLAALRCIGKFPELPEKHYQLTDWPDIGHAVDVPNIFNLIRLLQKGPLTSQMAIQQGGMDHQEALALLWALKASGVLVESAAPVARPTKVRSEKPAPESGFLGKLMQRFGLSLATSH